MRRLLAGRVKAEQQVVLATAKSVETFILDDHKKGGVLNDLHLMVGSVGEDTMSS